MADHGMKNLENLYLEKVKRRIAEIGERFIWAMATDIDVCAAETMEHLTPAEARGLRYRRVKDGFLWGRPWGTAWFRLVFNIPKSFRGECAALRFQTGGECLIFRNDVPVQALDAGRTEYIVTDRARGGEKVELYVEAGANSAFGGFEKRVMRQPKLMALNREVYDAYWDLAALAAMVDPTEQKTWLTNRPLRALYPDDPFRARILRTLSKAVDLFDYGNPTREELRSQAMAVRQALRPIYACRATDSAQIMACMGHAHIDVAWLWPLAETVRKCGRTFSNVVSLMDRYPEFVFVQSQPHLYEFTKERYPALYRRIKEKVKAGQWAPTGGMWVEADCNVTGGESLVRQILFGKRFFLKEFGIEVEDLWIPDVFGYSAALPQIIRKSRLKYFLTQKISWCQFSRFPYSSFWWQGIDGTKVLTHFPPVETYNAMLTPHELLSAAREYREKDRCSIQAVPFGFGDGGGGPNNAMIERMRRYRNIEGMPRLEPMSCRDFFRRLEKESGELPVWVGELYLEMHRGTYTTQARNKRNNRKSELGLRDAEMLSAWELADGGDYDQKRLNAAWKKVLLNQFHDILPGSSIDEVYRDSEKDYADILGTAESEKNRCLKSLAGRVNTRGRGVPVLAVNTLSWERRDVVAVAAPGLRRGRPYRAVAAGGSETPVQVGADGLARFRLDLPSAGHQVAHILEGGAPVAEKVEAGPGRLENDLIRVEFDGKGRISRILDKTESREIVPAGETANRFVVFEDKMATCGPAWDMEIYYNDKPIEWDGRLLSARVLETGPVRAVVRFRRAISHSVVEQDVALYAGSRRLDFITRIDWDDAEKDVVLKVAFPVAVHADKARYEIQYGSVERPTHWNRPHDFGMFEVPAQKWADLSEAGYGVALLNDCKYGHDIRGNTMRLTLLRAPKSPGKTADVGRRHEVTYALFPHGGDFRNGVVRAAYELNVPVAAVAVPARDGWLPPRLSRFCIDGDGVVLEAVKKAEDDDSLILRLYEAHGGRGRRTLRTSLPVSGVSETDLLERDIGKAAVKDGCIEFEIGPFEIKTFRLRLGKSAEAAR